MSVSYICILYLFLISIVCLFPIISVKYVCFSKIYSMPVFNIKSISHIHLLLPFIFLLIAILFDKIKYVALKEQTLAPSQAGILPIFLLGLILSSDSSKLQDQTVPFTLQQLRETIFCLEKVGF